MICPKCGRENNEESIFCLECGYSLANEKHITMSKINHKNISFGEINGKTMYLPKKKNYKKIILIIVAVIVVLGFYNLIKCDHDYSAATCLAPMTCKICGQQKGNAIEHKWVEATCKAPKTCSLCGKTLGKVLEHTPGKVKTEVDFVSAEKNERQYCKVCAELLDEKTIAIDKLHNGERFIITPYNFVSRLENELEDVPANTFRTASGAVKDSFACAILEGDSKLGAIMFVDAEEKIKFNDGNHEGFTAMMGYVNGVEAIGSVLIALFGTCDPTISTYEAITLAERLLEKGEIIKNGVVYLFSISGETATIGVGLD